MFKKSHEEKLLELISKKNANEEKIDQEKKELEKGVSNLENELDKELDFKEYRETKEHLEYMKDKLRKFLNRTPEDPTELINGIEKEFKETIKEIEETYNPQLEVAYIKMKSYLNEILDLLDIKNQKISNINNVVAKEKNLFGRELKVKLDPIYRNDQMRISKGSSGRPVIERIYGRYEGDHERVEVK